jgi:hypothetical protein
VNTTPENLSVESIERVLEEKEAVLAREQAMLEGLKSLLGRMGYELVPRGKGEPRRAGWKRALGAPSSSPVASTSAGGRGRGRPRKTSPVAEPEGDNVTG